VSARAVQVTALEDGVQLGARRGFGGGEERHLVAGGNEAIGQQLRHRLD